MRSQKEPILLLWTEKFHNSIDIYLAMIQLMAGAGVALIGTTLIPLLSGLFG